MARVIFPPLLLIQRLRQLRPRVKRLLGVHASIPLPPSASRTPAAARPVHRVLTAQLQGRRRGRPLVWVEVRGTGFAQVVSVVGVQRGCVAAVNALVEGVVCRGGDGGGAYAGRPLGAWVEVLVVLLGEFLGEARLGVRVEFCDGGHAGARAVGGGFAAGDGGDVAGAGVGWE